MYHRTWRIIYFQRFVIFMLPWPYNFPQVESIKLLAEFKQSVQGNQHFLQTRLILKDAINCWVYEGIFQIVQMYLSGALPNKKTWLMLWSYHDYNEWTSGLSLEKFKFEEMLNLHIINFCICWLWKRKFLFPSTLNYAKLAVWTLNCIFNNEKLITIINSPKDQ